MQRVSHLERVKRTRLDTLSKELYRFAEFVKTHPALNDKGQLDPLLAALAVAYGMITFARQGYRIPDVNQARAAGKDKMRDG